MKKVFLIMLLLLFSGNLFAKAEISLESNPIAVEALAKCLQQKNATMYGTKDCGHCNKQKEMFGSYFRYINFIDCRANKAAAKECSQQRVGKFPQWNFENNERIVREASLDQIARQSGCEAYITQKVGDNNYISSNSSNSVSEEISNSGQTQSEVYGTPEQLAKCLKAKNVKFYGSPKCFHCNKQKEMFEGAFEKYLSSNFHNCKGSSSEQAECYAKNTFPFPTWVENGTGKKLLGPERSLNQIAKTFNCTIDQQQNNEVNSRPSSNQIENRTNTNTDIYQVQPMPEKTQQQSNNIEEINNLSIASTYPTEDKALLEKKQGKLANCLLKKNIILYGITNAEKGKSAQYKATQDQLKELGSAAEQIKVVDCSAGQAECSGILVYPTWILDNKNELAGVYELTNLAQILNCPLD